MSPGTYILDNVGNNAPAYLGRYHFYHRFDWFLAAILEKYFLDFFWKPLEISGY